MAFPTVSAYTKFEIDLLDSGDSLLQTVQVLNHSNESFGLNYSPLRPYQSNTQSVKGDGTHVVSNFRLAVMLEYSGSDRETAMKDLEDDLEDTAKLRTTKGGTTYTRVMGASLGIQSWQPLGEDRVRCDIEFIPTTIYWQDGGAVDHIGVL